VPDGQGEPAVQGASAEHAVGVGFHLCRNLEGVRYVAFVIDAYARRIVGWRVSTSPHAGFVLDALNRQSMSVARSRAWGWFTTVIWAANTVDQIH
jgi:transposase InsO family protein